MANLTYSVYIPTKTISLDKTFTYSVKNKTKQKKKWRNRKKYTRLMKTIYLPLLSAQVVAEGTIFRKSPIYVLYTFRLTILS